MAEGNIDNLTMEQYLALTRGNQAPSVVTPEIGGNANFKIKSQFMRELREDTFFGNKNNDAHEHVERVLDIVSLFNISGVTDEFVVNAIRFLSHSHSTRAALKSGTSDLLIPMNRQHWCHTPLSSRVQRDEVVRRLIRKCARWTRDEEILLTQCWIETSENGQIGADRTEDSFWGQIMDDFNSATTQGYRTRHMLTSKWTRINVTSRRGESFNSSDALGAILKVLKMDARNPLIGRTHTEIFGPDTRPRPAGKTRPAKKTKSETTESSGGRKCGEVASGFCGNHTKRSHDTWIQCSIDPSHSVLESNLESHLKRCPLLKHKNLLYSQPFYEKGINGGDDEEDVTSESKRMAVHNMSVAEFVKIIEKIKSVHDSVCKDIRDSYIVPEACSMWINRAIDGKIPFQEKHVIQQASILGNLEKLGAMKSTITDLTPRQLNFCVSSADSSDSPAVVEFGAGRGYLTQMLADCYGVSKVFLVERRSYKLKADRSLRQKESLVLERLRVDIEDLNLNSIESLKGLPYLAIGKHLCGPATDKGFFSSLGMAKDEFHAVTWFTSWAVDADHSSNLADSSENESDTKTENEKDLGGVANTRRDMSENKSDTKMENEKGLGGVADVIRNMSARERAVLGFMCKDIIDAGRFMWMREYGLESELVKYVPSNISPENHLLVAKR
ncbi:tRNA:m(4)X modification enzyme TRM13 isoform X2 [Tanacetum coccineum]